jgi:hypothetical protein
MSQIFLSFDTQDRLAQCCAAMIASMLQDADVVVPQKRWALGSWKHYLHTTMARAERIIVILSPGYMTSTDSFVQNQRLFVEQVTSRLLVVQLGNCQPWLSGESVFCEITAPLDFRPILAAEEDFRKNLFEGIRITHIANK